MDTKIANVAGVSAVIGADDHYIITDPIYYPGEDGFKSTPIVQGGGEQDQYLGRLDLVYKYEDGAWTLDDFDGYLYDLEGVEADQEIQDLIDSYQAEEGSRIKDESHINRISQRFRSRAGSRSFGQRGCETAQKRQKGHCSSDENQDIQCFLLQTALDSDMMIDRKEKEKQLFLAADVKENSQRIFR